MARTNFVQPTWKVAISGVRATCVAGTSAPPLLDRRQHELARDAEEADLAGVVEEREPLAVAGRCPP